jgi:hypothetical protein
VAKHGHGMSFRLLYLICDELLGWLCCSAARSRSRMSGCSSCATRLRYVAGQLNPLLDEHQTAATQRNVRHVVKQLLLSRHSRKAA